MARRLDAGVPVDARGVDGGTPLHFVGLWGRGNTVELALTHGADPEMMSAPSNRLDALVQRTAEASLTVFETLVEIEEPHDRRGGSVTGWKGAPDGSLRACK